MTNDQLRDKLRQLLPLARREYEQDAVVKIDAIIAEILAANRRPRACVGAVVFDRTLGHPPKILMEHRSPMVKLYPNHWSLPGGWVEYGETFEQASVRELQEETGLIANLQHCKLLEVISHVQSDGEHLLTGFVLVCLPQGQPTIKESKKIDRLEYVRFSPQMPQPIMPTYEAFYRKHYGS